MEDLSSLPTSENKLNLTELLVGFFQYFATFDFSNKVISSRLGEAIDITQFKENIQSNPAANDFKVRL